MPRPSRSQLAAAAVLALAAAPALAGEPAAGPSRAVLGLTPGVSSFADVRAALGPAAEAPRDPQGPAVLCYRAKDPADPTVLRFTSSVYGGYGRVVSAISLLSGPAAQAPTGCLASAAVSRDLAMPHGLKLGQDVEAARALLPPAVSAMPSRLQQVRRYRRPPTAEERKADAALGGLPAGATLQVTEGAVVRFDLDKAVEVEVFRVDEP